MARKRPKILAQNGQFHLPRAKLVMFGVGVVFATIIARSVYVHVSPASGALNRIAKGQYENNVKLASYRGHIFDRRGDALALSIKKPSFFVNPRVFRPSYEQRKQLAASLGVNQRVFRKLRQRKGYFSWLKRKVDNDNLPEFNIKGLYKVNELGRFYGLGSMASTFLGLVGTDNEGLLGIERQFDEYLVGQRATMSHRKDARGNLIYDEPLEAQPEVPGGNVYLTIDRVIQEIAYDALEIGVKEANAKKGFAIVSDPHTGQILALANYPSFDPNVRVGRDTKNLRNYAFSDIYEPGSVIKPFVIGAALEHGLTKPDSIHNCHDGVYRDGSLRIRDTHPEETLTTEGVLIHSSNICSYLIAKKLGPKRLYETYRDAGIGGAAYDLPFPGFQKGSLSDWKLWREVRFANLAFGQGLMVNSFEMLGAWGAIANGGLLMRPYFADSIKSPSGEVVKSFKPKSVARILSVEVAKTLRQTLYKAIETPVPSHNAKMAFYTAGGKTGTTEKVDPETKRYSKDKRIASFIGFTPVKDPHLLIYVVIDEPGKKPYYGNLWAAPVFKAIADPALRYLNVAPDKGHVASVQKGETRL